MLPESLPPEVIEVMKTIISTMTNVAEISQILRSGGLILLVWAAIAGLFCLKLSKVRKCLVGKRDGWRGGIDVTIRPAGCVRDIVSQFQ